ncbi:serine/threonine kinase 19, isoform CRA_b [Rattus norvegicus]|nr:serine/threonine kinase 19, isoform CRA_b [Rattus norvegicus]
MTQTYGFRDSEITHLVNAGVLTVRDAGSWWLACPHHFWNPPSPARYVRSQLLDSSAH